MTAHMKLIHGHQSSFNPVASNELRLELADENMPLSNSNPEFKELTSPENLRSKSSFAGRMNDVHKFAVGQANLNKRVI